MLSEALDLNGLIAVLAGMRTGAIRCLAVDTTTPSAFAHELLNANPYAFLDDAPLRRAAGTSSKHARHGAGQAVGRSAGRLDPVAIAELRDECWPDVRDEHELHDLLCSLTMLPEETLALPGTVDWTEFFARLALHGRATVGVHAGRRYLVATERVAGLRRLWPELELEREVTCPVTLLDESNPLPGTEMVRRAVQGWMAVLGPVTSRWAGGAAGT